MRIEPLGISYGYYTSPYASGATRGAARTAMADMLQNDLSSVQPVDDVPEVFSNDEVDRVVRSPEELQADRRTAYEVMTSLTPRNAEHLNPALEFKTNPPFEGVEDDRECETCENRTYVDGSDENDVSFQTPGHIAPEAAASRVMAHEQEHVRNAYQEDSKEDKEIISASVSLKTAICPECGKTYVSGGETRTIMRSGAETNPYEKQLQAYHNFLNNKNEQFNLVA